MRACLAMLALVAGCAPAPGDTFLGEPMIVRHAEPPPPYTGPAFFPASLGQATIACPSWTDGRLHPALSDFERDWYSRHLAAAAEPSLYLASQAPRPAGASTLRFTWLRSFDAPVVIRVETAGPGQQRLVAKQLSGAGGYDPGQVEKTIERPLTPDEAGRLQAMLARARIFGLPPSVCDAGLDGAQWIFESVDTDGYHFLSFWTPRQGPANELGRFLMALTGWEFGSVY